MRIAIEVIPNALSTARQLVRLIEDEDLPALGICLDVGHARLQGDVVDALETVAGYLVTTHLHDNAGRRDDHLLPFDGVIDWPELIDRLPEGGVRRHADVRAGCRGRRTDRDVAPGRRRAAPLESLLGETRSPSATSDRTAGYGPREPVYRVA